MDKDETITEAYALACQGMSEASISRKLKMTPTEFGNAKRNWPELATTINLGWAENELQCVKVLTEALTDASMKVRMDAAKYFLGRRHNWTENVHLAIQHDDSRPSESNMSDSKLLEMLGQQVIDQPNVH